MTDKTSLTPISSATRSLTASQSSMLSPTKPSADRVDLARRAAKKILSGYPDFGKASPEYVVNLAESLSYLSEAELAIVLHPVTGVAARCKFLPTFADIMAVLNEHRTKQEQFQPAHTQYKRLAEETGPWDKETDFERKARVVKELLGYNPSPAAEALEPKRVLTAPTAEDMANLQLKTPPAPPSKYLIAFLEKQGWPFTPAQQEKTA